MHGFFPDDEQLNADFFSAKNVQFSVDLLCQFGPDGGATQRINPSFLVWVEDDAIFMADLDDGFSPSLASSLGQAIQILEDAGIATHETQLYWRDANKAWHRLPMSEQMSSAQGNVALV